MLRLLTITAIAVFLATAAAAPNSFAAEGCIGDCPTGYVTSVTPKQARKEARQERKEERKEAKQERKEERQERRDARCRDR